MNDWNTERVDILRQWLGNYDLEADKMLSADLHDREDIPDYWQCGQWSIGLDVSAGTAVLTLDDAALWTASRYFIAAGEALADLPTAPIVDGMTLTDERGLYLEGRFGVRIENMLLCVLKYADGVLLFRRF